MGERQARENPVCSVCVAHVMCFVVGLFIIVGKGRLYADD